MVLTVNDLHIFLENNLPGYQRRDVLAVCRFFLRSINRSDKKPLKNTTDHIEAFKQFICVDWQGFEINNSKVSRKEAAVDRCSCGGIFVVRTNRRDGTKFLGCSNYPKCRQTKEL